MSNPEEADTCVPDTQETYYEGASESFKIIGETHSASLNESQDFRLVDSEGDESMVERTKQMQDAQADDQKSSERTDPQEISQALRTEDDNAITATVVDEKASESEAIEKTGGNVSGELRESEKKDELSDEDEIIQGTPPQSYSPSRKLSGVDVTSLKRKAESVDEPPAKVPKITSADDAKDNEKRLEVEEEESRQSCESDDSYQDLFKNIDKNVIIEETQEPATLEFNQNTLKIPAERPAGETTIDDKPRECRTEQMSQSQDGTSEKNDMEKDENLNVSAKSTDISGNDSTLANINSTSENESQLEVNLSVGQEDVTSTSVVIADEKSGIGTFDKTQPAKGAETASGNENSQAEQSSCVKPAERAVNSNDEEIPSSQRTKSRISVELIFEGANRTVGDGDGRSKPQVVQIDDDGEMILDSSAEMTYDNRQSAKKTRPEVVQIDDSHEDGENLERSAEIEVIASSNKSSYESKISPQESTDFSYKESMKESSLESKSMDKRLVNGSSESKKSDTDVTLSLDSDTFSDEPLLSAAAHDTKKIDGVRSNRFMLKDVDNLELISISDNETSNVDEKNKSDLNSSTLAKTVQVKREIGVYVRIKCLMHVDESAKEPVRKEVIEVQCEPVIEPMAGKQKNEDSQSSLADISDNKDSSPGSVSSNPQYQLQSRMSLMSSVSSSSSASSAASLATKLGRKYIFQMPVGPVKHAKKSSQDILSTDKQTLDETYERLTREWKNHRLLTTTILNYMNTEVAGTSTATTAVAMADTLNVSNERLDHHHLEENMRSSTPADLTTNLKLELTPKSTKKGKAAKRPRSKLARSNAAQINGKETDAGNILNEPAVHTESDAPSSRKKIKIESSEDRLLMSDLDASANSSPQGSPADELIGKEVFAKWSDNKYYPGTVCGRLKTKYKVIFYDGKSKTLIPEFVIPIPKPLSKGMSVYATNDRGFSPAIIIDVQPPGEQSGDNTDYRHTYYTVEMDDDERLRVQVQDISLSADQAKMLKEEMNNPVDGTSLPPSTPKALGQVTLDNMVDGKRRSKRVGTPLFSTPKSRSSGSSTSTSKSSRSTSKSEPSVSGMSTKLKKEKASSSENESLSSDPGCQDEYLLLGMQREIDSMPYEQIKGPPSRIKSKSRSKRIEDPQTIKDLGPIPNSNIFKGMSFLLSCAPLETIDRYLDTKIPAASEGEVSATETEDPGTDYDDDWKKSPPFVRDRLRTQIEAGGGKVYEEFDQIPKDEYENTMLVTNVPNTTSKSILCLSAGIPVCHHKWIIRSCAEEKTVNPAEEILPNWSLHKKCYIDMVKTGGKKPLTEVVVIIIPSPTFKGLLVKFWQQVCENAGAAVLIAENQGAMDKIDFDLKNVVVVSNQMCPSWAVHRARQLQMDVLSTTWVIQCIIEGKRCPPKQHSCYAYNYKNGA
ncbi:PREDICTED: uncharacterized protein LOC105454382 [Wasmannia auropunctata]|uniref:uncharacterized protein LOC105454382 n=1 Tax=Wasmannia auropunctata TaxID=64793 RepID=UPI0005F0B05F|nr:PREDICTED: uncharacterized protein LOC105454382 [Wasmannia auropunctata]XP_011695262.1 PREDICTED: uncharacterized protein LOC105454382 [Wasmannia auropunctata]XP_011695263.1 PREDICTED: uncharacterized protein LOC105454382 [Wasmannia auropunctata]